MWLDLDYQEFMQDKILNPFLSAIILAGGQGSRLFPLTSTKSKPCVTFAGRYKLIDLAVSNAINAGIRDIFITTQYKSDELNSYLSKTFKNQNLDILTPILQKEPYLYKGTADSVRKNILRIAQHPCEYIFILSGDQIYNMDLLDMLSFAQEKKAELVIATVPVPQNDATRMGVIKVNQGKKITNFVEKPQSETLLQEFRSNTESGFDFLGSMGIYLFKKEMLINLLFDNAGLDFGQDLIPLAIQKGDTYAYIFNDYWEDVGTIHSYYHANLKLTKKEGFDLYGAPIHSQRHTLPSPKIEDAMLKSSIIADGSIIDAKEIINSNIGMRIHIKKGSTILNSVVMGNDKYLEQNEQKMFSIGKNCHLDGVIVDQECQIGDNVRLTNASGIENKDLGPIYIRDKIIIIPAATILPDNYELAL